jgi:S-DNA-T family DNA segregation ATPase FtsK/SpoIIIE
MRIILELQRKLNSRHEFFLVEADASTSVRSILSAIGVDLTVPLFVGSEQLMLSDSLAQSPICDGTLLTPVPGPPQCINRLKSNFELVARVRGSETRRWSLSNEVISVGRENNNTVVIADPEVSGRHLTLQIVAKGLEVVDLGSTNGTFVAMEPAQPLELYTLSAQKPLTIPLRSNIEIGTSQLSIDVNNAVDLRRDDEGGILFNRPSRLREPIDTFVVRLPDEINDREVQIDLLSSAAGGATGLAYGSYIPILGTGINVAMQKRRQKLSRKELQRRREEYQRELEEIDKSIGHEVARQSESLRQTYCNPNDLHQMSMGPDRRLWERRSLDSDSGEFRVGLGTRSADIAFEVRGDRPDVPLPQLTEVPIVLNLHTNGVIGIAGPRHRSASLVHWIIAQMSFFRPPRDVLIELISQKGSDENWQWITLLPHNSQIPKLSPFLIGNSQATTLARISELTAMLDGRLELLADNSATSLGADVLIVIDGARALRSTPGLVRLLREGPRAGIYFIALDDEAAQLPEECRGEIIISSRGEATVRVDGEKTRYGVRVDELPEGWTSSFARNICPLRLTSDGEKGDIPNSLRFIDMAEVDVTKPDKILEAWRREGRTTAAWVGLTATDPLELDLERDGPHALVAGTTGAGKSEFLQTMIASLALRNHPEALNFVLVDYKGASAFADCEKLPHTVGVVTNLDSHLTERALASLDAELHRRELILKDIGAADIKTAWRVDPAQSAKAGLARLVLVIDEFAELVHELPEFVTGLIRIARVGRSLGVHLVLATQRPSGVVTPEMRANTGLRVALRMQDKSDSAEVVDAPHAATISRLTPGRGFVRTGGSGLLTEFQTARVGGISSTVRAAAEVAACKLDWSRAGEQVSFPAATTQSHGNEKSDLASLCELIAAAADLGEIATPRRPWLDPLPRRLEPSTVAASSKHTLIRGEPHANTASFMVPVGIMDLPAEQSQQPFCFEIDGSVNWGIAGGPRSGKTTALFGIALSIARSTSPEDAHIYGLDFGGGGLLPLNSLAHCGAVIRSNESERVEAFVRKLAEEHRRRQILLAEVGAANVAEQRSLSSGVERLSYMIVLIDRWELVMQEFPPESGSNVPTDLTRLIREATTTGIRFVLAGDRGLLTDRVFAHLGIRLAMHLSDPNDYRQIDLQPKSVPSEMPPGRAVRAGDGVEIQFSLLSDHDSASPREVVDEIASQSPSTLIEGQIRIDPLPDRISQATAIALPHRGGADSDFESIFCVGGDTLSAITIPLWERRSHFLIAGSQKSGRTNAAIRMARLGVETSSRVLVVAGMSTRKFDELGSGVEVFGDSVFGEPADLVDLISQVQAMLIIDDPDRFPKSNLETALVTGLPGFESLRVVLTGTTDEVANDLRGLASSIKRGGLGIILQPQSPIDGQIFGQRIERTMLGGPPGRGQLFVDGVQQRVQVVLD